jgi:hypothetical protein
MQPRRPPVVSYDDTVKRYWHMSKVHLERFDAFKLNKQSVASAHTSSPSVPHPPALPRLENEGSRPREHSQAFFTKGEYPVSTGEVSNIKKGQFNTDDDALWRFSRETGFASRRHRVFIWYRSLQNLITHHRKRLQKALPETMTGIKFHVSLSHEEKMFKRGTQIVLDTLSQLEVSFFKIIEWALISKRWEPGREVTIYTYMCPELAIENNQINLFWSNVIRTLTHRLLAEGIKPAYHHQADYVPPEKDTMISDVHNYVTWRDDSLINHKPPRDIMTTLHPDSCSQVMETTRGMVI